MNLNMFKEKLPSLCIKCTGKGFIEGTQTSMRAACLFCHGTGHTNHGPRMHSANLIAVMKWCEDYIDGKKDGWYH